MLTPEQIKNLKKGDPIVIHTTFEFVDFAGDIIFNAPAKNDSLHASFISPEHVSLPSEHGTSVPTPKYDTDRKFRKGDKVNVTSRDGRYPVVVPMNCPWTGENVTVIKDEEDNGFVQVRSEAGHEMDVVFFFLKLVSSVEEQMPYSIDPANSNVLFKHGKKFATFEDDDEAQEVCDRLNTEWIKEQNTNE